MTETQKRILQYLSLGCRIDVWGNERSPRLRVFCFCKNIKFKACSECLVYQKLLIPAGTTNCSDYLSFNASCGELKELVIKYPVLLLLYHQGENVPEGT